MTQDTKSPWWVDRIGYQVYLPSFADSDGDGWGDLQGLISKLGYLSELGVDLLWLSPIHPSPFVDHGYDVADYTAVSPRFGSVADVDHLVKEAGRLGMRILLDLVPNHTSTEHEWFQHSQRDSKGPYGDYYIWRDASPSGGPPNNWLAVFGGKAWTFDEVRGQYYLHMFTPAQPDLNWNEPKVADEFDAILRFWLDRGIAGFRIDVAHGLVKASGLPDQPLVPARAQVRNLSGLPEDWFTLDHIYDFDQPEVLQVHRRWRQIADAYGALLLGEVYIVDPGKLARYLGADGLHLAFWFGLIESEWEPARYAEMLRAAQAAGPHLAWTQSSHDRSRAVTRYGGGDVGRRRALTLATLTIGLPAIPVVYQGEELGLDDAVIPPGDIRDPLVLQGGYAQSREVARTPMPWSPGHQMGFTTAEIPWLRMGDRTAAETASEQAARASSTLSSYRRLLAARHRRADLRHGSLEWIDTVPPLLGYRRGGSLVAANVGQGPAELVLPPGDWIIDFSSEGIEPGRVSGSFSVGPEQAVILARTNG